MLFKGKLEGHGNYDFTFEVILKDDQPPLLARSGLGGRGYKVEEIQELRFQVGETPWVPVESSNLAAAAWCPKNGIAIKFKNGGIYIYPRLDARVFEGLLEANSKGQFFHKEIKPETCFLKVA